MKNIVKLLDIIALAAIIGFSMASCAGGGTLVVKNTSATTYRVTIQPGSYSDDEFDLAGGASKSFSYDIDIGVNVKWSGGFKSVNVSGGKTVTVNIS